MATHLKTSCSITSSQCKPMRVLNNARDTTQSWGTINTFYFRYWKDSSTLHRWQINQNYKIKWPLLFSSLDETCCCHRECALRAFRLSVLWGSVRKTTPGITPLCRTAPYKMLPSQCHLFKTHIKMLLVTCYFQI